MNTAVALMGWVLMQVPPGQPADQPGYLMDGVAAVVEREVITRSDVERAARMELARRGAGLAALDLEVEDSLRATVLELLIAEELVMVDARRRERTPESDADVARHVSRFRAAFASEPQASLFLRALGMTDADLVELMRREARVERVLQEQVKTVAPTAQEVRQAAGADPQLKGVPEELALRQARLALERERGARATEAYLARLMRDALVRRVATFRGDAGVAP